MRISMQLFGVKVYNLISLVSYAIVQIISLCVKKTWCSGERLYWYNAETIESMAVNGSLQWQSNLWHA